MAKTRYYAVAVGRQPGVYTRWFGETGAQVQVLGFPGAVYKGFATIEEARRFLSEPQLTAKGGAAHSSPSSVRSHVRPALTAVPADRIVIYTDGSSLGNPGPGGYGVVVAASDGDREFSGGFRKTTNNRMELLACIVGLEQLEAPSAVVLYSDSRYVVDGITKGWAAGWQRNDWCKSNGEQALNIDLWQRLLDLCRRHDVRFVWVRGHAGNPGNERCDQLATRAAAGDKLPVDEGYESDLRFMQKSTIWCSL